MTSKYVIFVDQTPPATQKFIAHIALRCYSNVDAKTGGQYSKASRIPPNGALNELRSLDFDGTLLNFGLILKLGALVVWGPGQVSPCSAVSSGPGYKTKCMPLSYKRVKFLGYVFAYG